MEDTVRRVKRGISEPHLVVREFNKYYYRFRGPDDDAVDIFDEDWDNLLLLDACRYDTFEQRADLPGSLEKRMTRSSSTLEYLDEYIDGADLRDVVYVTANPQLYRKQDNIDINLHQIINVWQEEGWDDEFRTVRPETVGEAAIRAQEEYPNKRIVVHFIQPHYPFIGPTGQAHFDLDSLDFWNRVSTGEITVDEDVLWRAYEENLDVVLPTVEHLLTELQGKTVVTADHGEMIGERASPIPMREYGHPTELRTKELVTVPWLEYQNGERREITREENDSIKEMDEMDSDVVDERLEDLGYAMSGFGNTA